MKVICTATIENEQQRKNLVQCINIIGLAPVVSHDTVLVEYDGGNLAAEKLIELFQQFPFHGITTLS